MPPVVLLLIAGAGAYAGYRYVLSPLARAFAQSRKEAEARETLRREHERSGSEPDAAPRPKDLGALEWDEAAQAYRPAGTAEGR